MLFLFVLPIRLRFYLFEQLCLCRQLIPILKKILYTVSKVLENLVVGMIYKYYYLFQQIMVGFSQPLKIIKTDFLLDTLVLEETNHYLLK